MAYLTITPATSPYRIRAGSEVLGQTSRALNLQEGGSAAVVYVPRDDVDMSRLELSTRQTRCPHKGTCSYYHIRAAAGRLENAIWSYETPLPGAEAIAGHLAFYPNLVSLEVI